MAEAGSPTVAPTEPVIASPKGHPSEAKGGTATTPYPPADHSTGDDRRLAAANTKLTLVILLLSVALACSVAAIVALSISIAVDNKNEERQITTIVNRGRPAGFWYPIQPAGAQPGARLAHAATTAFDTTLFIHGGLFGFGNQSLNDLWEYHEPSDTWTELNPTGDVPTARLHHSMVTVNDQTLLLFGGFNVFNLDPSHRSLDNLFEYNIVARRWTRIQPIQGMPWPTPRGAHDAVVMNGYMWVFGGFPTITATGHHEELWRYDPRTSSWQNMTMTTPWPEGRIGFGFTNIGDTAFLLGGGCESTGQCGDTWRYHALTNRWEDHAPSGYLPTARRATHADVALYNMIYMFGGVNISVVGGAPVVKMLDDLNAYDPVANKWYPVYADFNRGQRPPATFGHSLNSLGSRLVLFGGRVGVPTSAGSNQLWEYDVVPPLGVSRR